MPDIKPCPWCWLPGGEANPIVKRDAGKAFVACPNCGARGPAVKDDDYTRDEYVIGQWNRSTWSR